MKTAKFQYKQKTIPKSHIVTKKLLEKFPIPNSL